MDEIFLLNEKLKEELVQNCKAVYAHTTLYPKGLNSIPFIAKIFGPGVADEVPYYETCVGWSPATEGEDIENALNCIDFYSKKINKIAIMTDIIEEENAKGIYFTWAIFVDKNEHNVFDLG